MNQDALTEVVAETQSNWERKGHLFVVADGMGAHAAGELASKLAVDLIPHHYSKSTDQSPPEGLHQSIAATNAEIYRRGQANIEFRSMGTTCSALTLLPEGAVVAHVGDSRVYQLRGSTLYQLTFDHSLVWEMQAAGEVTDETARSGVIPKNVITRSLGPNASVQIDLEGPFPVQKGDRFLLCSDGLSGQVTDDEIAALMLTLSVEEVAQVFVDLSNLRGGPDNITAIVVEVAENTISTSHQGNISIQRPETRKPFSPMLAIVSAVCLIAAVAFIFLLNQMPLAIVSGVLGLIALATGVAQVISGSSSQSSSTSTRYGNGPYRQYKAAPDEEFYEELKGVIDSLRQVFEERRWKIDEQDILQRTEKIASRAASSDFSYAIQQQARMIIELMARIRSQEGDQPNASDSAVDL